MTDKELKDLVFSLAIESKKTDEQMKRTDEQIKTLQQETQQEIKALGKYIGNIARNQGDIAEEFFVNSISATLKIGGIQYDELYKNLYKKTKKAEGEFDIVLVNGKQLLMIETKYKAHENDLDNLINKKYKNFKNLYPEYKDYIQNIGLASFYINDDTKQKALSENIMILQRKGDIIRDYFALTVFIIEEDIFLFVWIPPWKGGIREGVLFHSLGRWELGKFFTT